MEKKIINKSSSDVVGTTVLFRILYNKAENVIFIFCFCLCFIYLCENYYKPIIVQYYIANCMIWEHRLCWTYEQSGLTNALLEQSLFDCRGLTV